MSFRPPILRRLITATGQTELCLLVQPLAATTARKRSGAPFSFEFAAIVQTIGGAVTYDPRADFAQITAGQAAFGALGGIAAAANSADLVKKYDLVNPSLHVAEKITVVLKRYEIQRLVVSF